MAKRLKKMKFFAFLTDGTRWFIVAVAISFCLHIISFVNIDHFGGLHRSERAQKQPVKVKIKLVSKKDQKDKEKQIIEAPMKKTKPPKKARYAGAQDHSTQKETKARELAKRKPGLNPGQGGQEKVGQAKQAASTSKSERKKFRMKNLLTDQSSKISGAKADLNPRKPRNAYESLMPNKHEMRSQRLVGYQDRIDDDIAEGDVIDLNTSNYRYIGYFTTVRKAFELAWVYPRLAARNGWQGTVKVQFTILKSGQVGDIRIMVSSGYQILDDAVVEALRLSSPYGPLPDGIEKDQLRIVGSFSYVLSRYATAR